MAMSVRSCRLARVAVDHAKHHSTTLSLVPPARTSDAVKLKGGFIAD
jgi:hypothetical protein